MENHDPLGTAKLSHVITQLIDRLDRSAPTDADPFGGMVTEKELSKRFGISRSTLRQWRREGVIRDCWAACGNLILYKPEILWQELRKID